MVNMFNELLEEASDDETGGPVSREPVAAEASRRVWTFARPLEYYTKVYREVMCLSPGGTLVIVAP